MDNNQDDNCCNQEDSGYQYRQYLEQQQYFQNQNQPQQNDQDDQQQNQQQTFLEWQQQNNQNQQGYQQYIPSTQINAQLYQTNGRNQGMNQTYQYQQQYQQQQNLDPLQEIQYEQDDQCGDQQQQQSQYSGQNYEQEKQQWESKQQELEAQIQEQEQTIQLLKAQLEKAKGQDASVVENQTQKTIQQEQKKKSILQGFKCPEHPEQNIKYIILTEQSFFPENMGRFACSECIANRKAAFSQDICILEDFENDELAILKFTSKKLVLQLICNMYHKNDPKLFENPENEINRQFNRFQQLFIYRLDQMRKQMIQQAQNEKKEKNYKTQKNHKAIQKSINDLKQKTIKNIPKKQLFDAIDAFIKAEQKEFNIENSVTDELAKIDATENQKLFSYQWENLNSEVNKFVEDCLYKKETQDKFDILKSDLEQIENEQSEFYNFYHLRATKQKMLYQLDQLKFVFQDRFLKQSELSDNFLNKILTEDQASKGKLIYRSSKDGLDYIQIQKLSPQFKDKSALYIFQTFTDQTFGVYHDKNQIKNSLLFHMTRRHKYPNKIDNQKIVQIHEKANLAEALFTFGLNDLVISANMVDCTSNLGEGFNTELQKEFITEETKNKYLASAERFSIKNMEILVFE